MPIIRSKRTVALEQAVNDHLQHQHPEVEVSSLRAFKGVWVPQEIWLNKKLSWFEKCLLAEIDSFDGGRGCFASAAHLAKIMGSTTGSIRYSLSRLRGLGWIKDLPSDDRNRRFIAVVKHCGALVVTNGGALAATNTEVLVKGIKALKPLNGEENDLFNLFEYFTREEISAYGANWRLRYRECPDKFARVVADLHNTKQEGKAIKSYAAIANIRWNEFTPRTKR